MNEIITRDDFYRIMIDGHKKYIEGDPLRKSCMKNLCDRLYRDGLTKEDAVRLGDIFNSGFDLGYEKGFDYVRNMSVLVSSPKV